MTLHKSRSWRFCHLTMLLLLSSLSFLTPPVLVPPVLSIREGDAHLAAKEFAQAERSYQAAVSFDRRQALPHLRLAQVYAARGRYDRAKAEYEAALSSRADDVPARVGLGIVEMERGGLAEAARRLAQALDRQPRLAQARYYLGLAYLRDGKLDTASKEFATLLKEPTPGPRDDAWRQKAHYRLGQILLATDTAAAITHLQEATRSQEDRQVADDAGVLLATAQAIKNQGDGEAYASALLGHAFLKVHEPVLARRQLEAALSREPDYVDALSYLGYAYWLEGKPDKALETLAKVTALEPDQPLGHYFLGIVLARLKRIDEAAAELERAARLDPDDAALLVELANVLATRGDYARAEALFQRAGVLEADNPEIQVLLARFYLDRAYRFERALTIAERTVDRWPDRADAIGALGWALYATGRPDDAREALQRAADIDPASAEIHYRLGVVLQHVGENASAALEYRRAIDLDRGTRYAEQATSALKTIEGP